MPPGGRCRAGRSGSGRGAGTGWRSVCTGPRAAAGSSGTTACWVLWVQHKVKEMLCHQKQHKVMQTYSLLALTCMLYPYHLLFAEEHCSRTRTSDPKALLHPECVQVSSLSVHSLCFCLVGDFKLQPYASNNVIPFTFYCLKSLPIGPPAVMSQNVVTSCL